MNVANHLSHCRYLILDGTFMERPRGLFAAMNGEDHVVVQGAVDVTDGPRDLGPFCRTLAQRGARPKAATINGNPRLTRTFTRHLRELFLRVCSLYTPQQRDQFLDDLHRWESHYGRQIATRPERGRAFSDLRRALSMLLATLPDTFHYLQDPRIPRSINSLEGYFGRLKQKYRQHPGLAKHRRHAYFLWYFHLCPR